MENITTQQFFEYSYIQNTQILKELRTMIQERKAYFLPGNVPSLKNSKEIKQIFTKMSSCCYRKGGLRYKDTNGVWRCTICNNPAAMHTKAILSPSDNALKYQEQMVPFFKVLKGLFKEWIKDRKYPLPIAFYFIRDQYRIFDYGNASEILQDEMVHNDVIEDDNMKFIIPEYLGCHYNKNNPGVVICLMTETLYRLKIENLFNHTNNDLF
jgi:hypothetical protein